jgi:hypothetical protein
MKTKIIHAISIAIVSLALSSCVNFRAVNKLSSESLTVLRQFDEIKYTYLEYCRERCMDELVRKHSILRDTEIKCNCNHFQEADRVTRLIYNAIKGYLQGIYELSDKDLTSYKFDILKNSIAAGKFGDLTVDAITANAYSQIAKTVTDMFAATYRNRKLREAITDANTPLQHLIQFIKTAIQNLRDEFEFKKERIHTIYAESLREESTEFQKRKNAAEYYRLVNEIDVQQRQMDTYILSLDKIAAGHQELYDNRNKLSKKELRETILQYASAIQELIAQLNQLKN